MGLAIVNSWALMGLQSCPVQVEVHLANGLPSFTLVGLAQGAVKEARERVRCAIQQSGFDFPSNQRIRSQAAKASKGICPLAAKTPKAMGKSKLLESLGKSEGARFTVMRWLLGKSNPDC